MAGSKLRIWSRKGRSSSPRGDPKNGADLVPPEIVAIEPCHRPERVISCGTSCSSGRRKRPQSITKPRADSSQRAQRARHCGRHRGFPTNSQQRLQVSFYRYNYRNYRGHQHLIDMKRPSRGPRTQNNVKAYIKQRASAHKTTCPRSASP